MPIHNLLGGGDKFFEGITDGLANFCVYMLSLCLMILLSRKVGREL